MNTALLPGSLTASLLIIGALYLNRMTAYEGRHRLTKTHPGWEAQPRQLVSLGICGDANPWDNRITCTRTPHNDERHEAVVGYHDRQVWNDRCHFVGDDCGPTAHLDAA